MQKKRWIACVLATVLGVLAPTQAFAANADWTEGNALIAHALGEYEGKIETNSKEAFLQSWENGFRVMEADFVYTSDNVLVVRHDFEPGGSYYRLEIQPNATQPVMDLNTFLNTKIVYEQTPLTAEDLLELMVEYSDVYLVTDTKNTDEATIKSQFQDLYEIAHRIGHPEILDRIIPQIYHEDMLGWVQSIYPFPQWIYTLYQQADIDYAETAQFCAANNIGVVTIEKSRVTWDIVQTFKAQGVKVYVHTVNRYMQLQELLNMGVSGIYTDTIKPYELPWVGLSNLRKLTTQNVTLNQKQYGLHMMNIMGMEYVSLRDVATMLSENGGFSASYDPVNHTVQLQKEGTFTTLGNELLLDTQGRLVVKKANNTLTYAGTPYELQGYTVDGDLYYPWSGLMDVLGYNMTFSSNAVLLQPME